MSQYPEIIQLLEDLDKYDIKISSPYKFIRKDLFFITLSLSDQTWNILIEDEYNDFSETNLLTNWFLVLFNLESYTDTSDYLEWAKDIGIKGDDSLEYYKSLAITCSEVESIIGKIKCPIRPFDYSHRTGVVQELFNTAYE